MNEQMMLLWWRTRKSFQMVKSELRTSWRYSEDKFCPLHSFLVGLILFRVNFQEPRNFQVQKWSWSPCPAFTSLNHIAVGTALAVNLFTRTKGTLWREGGPFLPTPQAYPSPSVSVGLPLLLREFFSHQRGWKTARRPIGVHVRGQSDFCSTRSGVRFSPPESTRFCL